jgi:hypothetical protein
MSRHYLDLFQISLKALQEIVRRRRQRGFKDRQDFKFGGCQVFQSLFACSFGSNQVGVTRILFNSGLDINWIDFSPVATGA